jgi:hypothetical protein
MLQLAFSLFLVWFIYGASWEIFDMIYTTFVRKDDMNSDNKEGAQ